MLNTQNESAANARQGQGEIRCQEVDPLRHAQPVAALLRRSWTPPCLLYSDAYVRWQLECPGPVRPRVLVAVAGSLTVGSIAVCPRVIRFGGRSSIVQVLSFLSVHPDFRDARVGMRLAELLLSSSDRPTLAYTAPGSPSGHILAKAALSRGWAFRRVGELRTYLSAGSIRHGADTARAREATLSEFLTISERSTSSDVAWSCPSAEQVAHYLSDPRGACTAIVEGPGNELLGGALVVRSEVVTAQGVVRVPSLDAVFLQDAPAPAPALRALARFALDRWPGSGTATVTAPNLDTVPGDAIRAAGFRAIHAAFNLAVMGDESDPIVVEVAATNLEVF